MDDKYNEILPFAAERVKFLQFSAKVRIFVLIEFFFALHLHSQKKGLIQ